MKHPRLKLALTGLLLVAGSAGSFDMSNVPLFVTGNVAPNLVLTLDDSGSMRRGYVPEHCNDASDCEALDNRWAKAANGNALYYNPNVYYPAPFNADLSRRSTSFNAAWVNGFYTEGGAVNLAASYRPTAGLQMGGSVLSCAGNGGSSSGNQWSECHMGHYSGDLATLQAPNANSPVQAYYYNYNTELAGCKTLPAASRKNASECYQLVIVGASSGPGQTDINGDGVINDADKDERQNFANWYSFYRTRNLAVISAASLAFANLSATSRLSWQALNTCNGAPSLVTGNCTGWSGNFGSNRIDVFGNATHRQNFYGWLSRLPTNSDTPLRQALIRTGEYFKTTGENSPYDNDFSTGNSEQYSCRRNFHILMTDGIWNDSLNNIGNIDGEAIAALPDDARTPYDANKAYTRAYRDSTRDTLSDLAFKYWATDLAPALKNNLTPAIEALDNYDASDNYGSGDGTQDTTQQIFWNARNNPATWQHMVNFTIGLGLSDYLQKAALIWTGDMFGGTYFELMNGSKIWPPATETMGRWGDEYGKSAHDLWHTAINSRGRFFSAESPEALRDAFEKIISMVEAATPTAAALASNSTNTSANAGQKTRVFQARFDTRYWNGSLYALEVDGQTGTVSGPLWDASTQLNQQAASARKIFIRGTNGATTLSWGNLTASQKTALNQSDSNGSLRLDWLRGDHSKEQRFVGGMFRNRTAFERNYDGTTRQTRSDWVLGDIVASDPLYVGAGSQQYDQLPAGTSGRDSYTAYVSTKASRTPMIYVGANDGMLHAFRASDGFEQSAVIPTAVFPNLHQLTKLDYTHRYYVDGSPSGGDAFIGGSWKTVVVSGLRAGGKSVFAVDATQPDSPAASQFMWEFNADGSDDNMGYSYGQPQVVRLNDGNWAAVFGNGYNSKNGGASLYIVNLADGSLIQRIDAFVKKDSDNGLSTPTLVDTDGDRIVDVAYAGDLKGNIWKFDLKSGSASSWRGSILFTAQDGSSNAQPITVQPNVVKGDNGYWVFFGTGRMLSSSDIEAAAMSKTQSFYGLWDNNSAISSRDNLVAQTVTNTTSLNGTNLRLTSDNAVDLSSKRGWYMELPDGGERVTAEATTVIDNVSQNDNRIVFTTAIPSSDPCSAQGSGWLMELSFKGRRPTKPVFDLNKDLKFDSGDTVLDGVIPTGMQSTVGIMDSVTWLDKDADVAFKLVPGTKGKIQTITNRGRGLGGRSGRVSWQQLM